MTAALLAFLRAAHDEIERVAEEATTTGPWHVERREVVADNGHHVVADAYGNAGMHEADMHHIALHDPRAALVRVESERALLAMHWPFTEDDLAHGYMTFAKPRGCVCQPGPGLRHWPRSDWPCQTVRLLAYGHRHTVPGFDPAWAPEGVSADA